VKRFIMSAVFLLLAAAAHAGVHGRLMDLCGVLRVPGGDPSLLTRVRLEASYDQDLDASWRLELGGLGTFTRAETPFSPPSSFDGQNGYDRLEWEELRSSGRALWSARAQKAFLKYAHGRWEVAAGRVPMVWGDSKFFRPTGVFRAAQPLEAFGDPPVGSDGADAQVQLAANTALEAAGRVLRDGSVEGVVRLENRGIGVMGTPLYAYRAKSSGVGAEVAATFKKFQLRAEGVTWKREGQKDWLVEAIGGLSLVIREFPVHLEVLKDGTGEALGAAVSGLSPDQAYATAKVETPRIYRVRFSPTLAKGFSRGDVMAMPGFVCEPTDHWSLGVDGMWFLGNGTGTLSALPSRMWGFVSLVF